MHPDISTAKADAVPSAKEIFLDDCRFAKVVDTPSGEALLIGGKLFHVAGPERTPRPDGVPYPCWAFELARALRKIDVRQTSGLQYGTLATEPLHQATADFVDDVRVQFDVSCAHVNAYPMRPEFVQAEGFARTEGPDMIMDRLEKRVDALEKYAEELGRTDATIVDVVNRCAKASGVNARIEPRDVSLS